MQCTQSFVYPLHCKSRVLGNVCGKLHFVNPQLILVSRANEFQHLLLKSLNVYVNHSVPNSGLHHTWRLLIL